jgi:peptidoglycan-N-acetylglucosamine deacetylase
MKNPFLIQPNWLLRRIYPKALWNMDRREKVIYLTFDDGPIEGLTEWVLGELQRFGAKATFFCVGANVQKHAAVFEKIKVGGHVAANHTMKHLHGLQSTVEGYLDEAEACRGLVNNALFRPPYGRMRRGQYHALLQKGYIIVLWDVISYDYENIEAEDCAGNVIRNAHNGSIVLFHDNLKAERNLKHALPRVLEHFSALGYRFEALPVHQQ